MGLYIFLRDGPPYSRKIYSRRKINVEAVFWLVVLDLFDDSAQELVLCAFVHVCSLQDIQDVGDLLAEGCRIRRRLLISCVGRLIFGKKSVLNQSVSSAIGILFIYCLYIVIHATGVSLGFMLSPLPFISLEGDFLSVFIFAGKDYTVICGELLNMVILESAGMRKSLAIEQTTSKSSF